MDRQNSELGPQSRELIRPMTMPVARLPWAHDTRRQQLRPSLL